MGMVDVRQKALQVQDSSKKSCVDCNTTKTPLWRGGPAGPKTLCNACGIKFRKKRISTNSDRKREKLHNNGSIAATSSSDTTAITTTNGGRSGDEEGNLGQCRSVRMRLKTFWEEVVVVQNVPSSVKKQRCRRWKKVGEEEQAAASLMELSCGSVFA